MDHISESPTLEHCYGRRRADNLDRRGLHSIPFLRSRRGPLSKICLILKPVSWSQTDVSSGPLVPVVKGANSRPWLETSISIDTTQGRPHEK